MKVALFGKQLHECDLFDTANEIDQHDFTFLTPH
jgi:hypothetical protein